MSDARPRIVPARATITKIAREAGVSTATVDRALNNRAGVRQRTRSLVLDVAERLGYLPESGVNGWARATPVSDIALLLPGGTNTFLKMLAHYLEATAEARRFEARVTVHLIEGFNPDALARKLVGLKGQVNAIGVIALDHPTVREAIRDVVASGIPVLTMISDISNVPRIGYVGIDNRAAGRLAGHLLGRLVRQGGKQVALFAGSLSYRGHEEREMGFRHILAEEYPDLEVVELREVKDDTERAYGEARTLLAAYRNLAGIYNIGAGNRGIARALEESGRASDVIFICHEVTEHTRRFLLSGTVDAVIDQNPRVEARDAIDWLIHAAQDKPPANLPPIRIQAVFKENIPLV
jgi:LacI family transcriptional regulator